MSGIFITKLSESEMNKKKKTNKKTTKKCAPEIFFYRVISNCMMKDKFSFSFSEVTNELEFCQLKKNIINKQ